LKRMLTRCLVALLLTSCAAQGQTKAPYSPKAGCVGVRDGAFHSAALDREMKYRVLLPCSYQAGGGRFPVLYLLHGLYGNYLNWSTLTNLKYYAEKHPLIVVMPDAGDSWYTNSATDPKDKFEDYVAKDLLAEIDGQFRTLRERQARAIAGLSMGGYGALKIALRYHDNFAFAGSLSGALDAPQDLGDRVPAFRDQLLKVFGPAGSAVRRNNNVSSMLQAASPADIPYLYLACGSADADFLQVNREFAASLSSRGANYEYHETTGGHAWDYWDRSVRDLLRAAAKAVSGRRLGVSD